MEEANLARWLNRASAFFHWQKSKNTYRDFNRAGIQIERRTLLKKEPSTSETVWLVAPTHNPIKAAMR